MELLSQKQFEDQLKMIFFQTGHADIWDNIQKRVQEGEQAQREAQRRARDAAIKKAKIAGIGLATVRSTTHAGAIGYYTLMAFSSLSQGETRGAIGRMIDETGALG